MIQTCTAEKPIPKPSILSFYFTNHPIISSLYITSKDLYESSFIFELLIMIAPNPKLEDNNYGVIGGIIVGSIIGAIGLSVIGFCVYRIILKKPHIKRS